MKTFTVLTCSKRTGWERLAVRSIAKQIAEPDCWVVVTEQPLEIKDFNNILVYNKAAPLQIRNSNLNASLNAGLRLVKTDYVIFYQDFIELQPDCFEKLLRLADKETFVTTCTPNYDNSNDIRYTGVDMPRNCRPAEWESNVAIAPMKALKELGGFDEEYDNGWSWDNVNLAERADILGYKFIIDESNRPKLLPHEQTSKLEMPLNAERHEKTMKAIREGHKPLKLNYL